METITFNSGLSVSGFSPNVGYIVKYPTGYYSGAYKQTPNPEQARLYSTEKYARKVLGESIGEVVKVVYN